MTLADAGYFAASHLAECDRAGGGRGTQVPHRTDSPMTSTDSRRGRIQHGTPLRCTGPVQRKRYHQGDGRSLDRAADEVLRPSRLDVHRGCQRSSEVEKAAGRASLRNHQGATGCTEIPVAGPLQRDCRVDPLKPPSTCAHWVWSSSGPPPDGLSR